MARKAIQGYTEKNYYDNTKYRGITATTDPLNEGYFRNLVNFDISDTGQSLRPRKGFLTTVLSDGTNTISLSDQTVIFKEHNTQEYIVFDIQAYKAYLVDISLHNIQKNTIPITQEVDIDAADVLTYLEDVNAVDTFNRISIYQDADLYSLRDGALIRKNIIKVQYTPIAETGVDLVPNIFWLLLYYRKDATQQGSGTSYEANTLVLEVLDTEQQPGVYVTDRNIASYKSFIPDPMQIVYEYNKAPVGHIDSFPTIYVKTDKGYTPFLYNKPLDVTVIPHFLLEDPGPTDEGVTNEETRWAYTYDVLRMDKVLSSDDAVVYNAPVYDLETNTPLQLRFDYYNLVNQFLTSTPVGATTATMGTYIHERLNYNLLKKTLIILAVPDQPSGTWEPTAGSKISLADIFDTVATYMNFTTVDVYTQGGKLYLDALFTKPVVPYEHSFIFYIDSSSNSYYYHDGTYNVGWTRENAYLVYLQSLLNNFNDVSSIEDLTNALLNLPNTFRFIVKIYDDTYLNVNGNDYDKDKGSLLERTCMYNMAFATRLKQWTEEGVIHTNSYERDTLTRVQLLNYITENYCTDVFIKIFPVSFTYSYHENHDTNNIKKIIPTKAFNGANRTPFFMYVSALQYATIRKPIVAEDMGSWMRYSHRVARINYNEYTSVDAPSIFTRDNDTQLLQVRMYKETTNPTLQQLFMERYFIQGVSLVLYLFPLAVATETIPAEGETPEQTRMYMFSKRLELLTRTSLMFALPIYPTNTPIIPLQEQLTKEPTDILESDNYTVFNDIVGDRLVVWKNNIVYISEPGNFYYFKEEMRKEYVERVVKVIQFKEVLLVFTTQHLYAIYTIETTETVESAPDEEGRTTAKEVITITYVTTPVLYNILTSDKYKDAIQVFNQMVLFYSADGQMYMIKPSTTIDSDTRFSLQYFNKSANDILLNYTDYINERLRVYGIDRTVTENEVKIKVLISINFIKTFYTVEDLITYVLVYDVLNNYYYVLDTLTFSNIHNLMYIEGGEVYTTTHNDRLYITLPFTENNAIDNNVDTTFVDNFSRHPIHAEIDTGIFNLNNHLTKRFRDLYVTYKNLNATELEFALETFLDDVMVQTYLDTSLEIKDIGGQATLVPVTTQNTVKLFNNEHALFDFSGYQANKLLTHRGQILGIGKAFRMKMQFISKGSYKIQDFGIVYKERRV